MPRSSTGLELPSPKTIKNWIRNPDKAHRSEAPAFAYNHPVRTLRESTELTLLFLAATNPPFVYGRPEMVSRKLYGDKEPVWLVTKEDYDDAVGLERFYPHYHTRSFKHIGFAATGEILVTRRYAQPVFREDEYKIHDTVWHGSGEHLRRTDAIKLMKALEDFRKTLMAKIP